MLEPVDLTSLAQALRDEVWVDLRAVDHGIIERVRIIAFIIDRHNDILTLYQEWVAPGGVAKDRTFQVDSEDIMWCKVSQFDREDVEPKLRLESTVILDSNKRWDGLPHTIQPLVSIIIEECALEFQVDPTEVAKLAFDAGARVVLDPIHCRYTMMWTLYELTGLSPLKCCNIFNWSSQTPWISARSKLEWGAKHNDKAGQALAVSIKTVAPRAKRRAEVFMGPEWPDVRDSIL